MYPHVHAKIWFRNTNVDTGGTRDFRDAGTETVPDSTGTKGVVWTPRVNDAGWKRV